MKDRKERQLVIQRIIEEKEISSQDELLEELEKLGFSTTQATLSRDLKVLGVGKAVNGKGDSVYTLPDAEDRALLESSLRSDIIRGFVLLEFSGNFGVIRTLPGHASTVAYALDSLNVDEVLGTIAGDDTVLVIPRDGVARDGMNNALLAAIPQLKEKL